MAYPNWLKIIKNKSDKIHVGKIKPESIDFGEMASGSPSQAADKLSRILDQRNATTKILVVSDGVFSAKISEYAIKMGQRLDCEIVALSLFEASSQVDECEQAHFLKRAEMGGSNFGHKAANAGIKLQKLERVGTKKKVVNQVVKEIAGIRYVLSEPDTYRTTEQFSGCFQGSVVDDTIGSN